MPPNALEINIKDIQEICDYSRTKLGDPKRNQPYQNLVTQES